MARILIVATVNIDRIWRLDKPLRAGDRHGYSTRELRVGGGGFFTGAVLVGLGHEVQLAATLARDELGRACFDALSRRGFDLSKVQWREGPTSPIDVLVEPSGERAILAPADTEQAVVEEIDAGSAELVYVNARRVREVALADVVERCPVVAQHPLEPGEHRPATVLIAARSDFGAAADGLAAIARVIAGEPLRAFVLTDGEHPVRLWTDRGAALVAVETRQDSVDTTGAGDAFAAGLIDAWLRGEAAERAVLRASRVAAVFLADRSAFLGSDAAPLGVAKSAGAAGARCLPD